MKNIYYIAFSLVLCLSMMSCKNAKRKITGTWECSEHYTHKFENGVKATVDTHRLCSFNDSDNYNELTTETYTYLSENKEYKIKTIIKRVLTLRGSWSLKDSVCTIDYGYIDDDGTFCRIHFYDRNTGKEVHPTESYRNSYLVYTISPCTEKLSKSEHSSSLMGKITILSQSDNELTVKTDIGIFTFKRKSDSK